MKINKIYSMIRVVLLLLLPCAAGAQQMQGYQITGRIKGLNEGEKVLMRLSTSKAEGDFRKHLVNKDSAYVKNGMFVIKGVVPEGPRRYEMVFDQHNPSLFLYINNNENITINANDDALKKTGFYIQHFVTIEGSPTNAGYMELEPVWMTYSSVINHINGKMQDFADSVGYDRSAMDAFNSCKTIINGAFYRTALSADLLATMAPERQLANTFLGIVFNDSEHASFWVDFYNSLTAEQKQSFNGQWIASLLPRCVGQTLPPFTLPGADGKMVALKDITAKSKLTLVHFWANKSIQREAYDKDLRKMYQLYHDKGLTIVGVSTQALVSVWKEILDNEKYPWLNVIDKKGQQIVDPVYHEYGGPEDHENTTNVLLDKDGKIIAWDPTGVALQYDIDRYLSGIK